MGIENLEAFLANQALARTYQYKDMQTILSYYPVYRLIVYRNLEFFENTFWPCNFLPQSSDDSDLITPTQELCVSTNLTGIISSTQWVCSGAWTRTHNSTEAPSS
ncbi:hypothetical protein TNCV_3268341 [Trichonephila clavipes]|nr:hypothetical protein TNCV_3268341 [Trichonephila clavipes]